MVDEMEDKGLVGNIADGGVAGTVVGFIVGSSRAYLARHDASAAESEIASAKGAPTRASTAAALKAALSNVSLRY